MGFGGINVHVVVSSYSEPSSALKPSHPVPAMLASTQRGEVFVMAAASVADLAEQVRKADMQPVMHAWIDCLFCWDRQTDPECMPASRASRPSGTPPHCCPQLLIRWWAGCRQAGAYVDAVGRSHVLLL
jgi:hypothetical protein